MKTLPRQGIPAFLVEDRIGNQAAIVMSTYDATAMGTVPTFDQQTLEALDRVIDCTGFIGFRSFIVEESSIPFLDALLRNVMEPAMDQGDTILLPRFDGVRTRDAFFEALQINYCVRSLRRKPLPAAKPEKSEAALNELSSTAAI